MTLTTVSFIFLTFFIIFGYVMYSLLEILIHIFVTILFSVWVFILGNYCFIFWSANVMQKN